MKLVLGFILLAFFAIPSHNGTSNTNDGNFLLISCQLTILSMDNHNEVLQVPYDSWRDGMCSGIVSGVNFASPSVCPTEGVTLGQSVRVVYKYLLDHPERLNLRDAKLAEEALSQAFPCKR
jgi:hypothetical protein